MPFADGVRMTTAESFLESRWNLGSLAPTLRNAWVLGRLGVGLDLFGYPARGSFAEDALPLLVVDAGMGVPIVVSGNGGVGFEAKWDGSSLHYLGVAVDPASGKVEISVVAVE